MTDDSVALEAGPQKKEFSIVRKGYDPDEVDAYRIESDVAFRELQEYAGRIKQELAEARFEISRLKASEQESIDNAMQAVFDAKDRIMERAKLRAREIEDEARVAAGFSPSPAPLPAAESVSSPDGSQPEPPPTAGPSDADPVKPIETDEVAPSSADGVDPSEILHQMLREADTIKSQLEAGMTAAFDQIEQMQHEAEDRAAVLLDEARREAARLRSGEEDTQLPGTTVEVTLPSGEDDEGQDERRSRYSRNSAKLPRIGSGDGQSVLASMNELRLKLHEVEDVAQEVQDLPTS